MSRIDINFSVSLALGKREFIKYLRNRATVISSIFQSLIFLFIFGFAVGNQALVAAGIIPQAILFAGIFSGTTIIMDRMFGFFKELMVAPVSRTTITLGNAIGGTLIASIQGILLLILTSLFGSFGYDPTLFLKILAAIPVVFLIALLCTSLGNLIASRMKDFQQLRFLMTFLVLPMFFTSGALIDFVGTPFYNFTLINPMTYAVDLMRHIMLMGNPALSVGLPLYVDIIALISFSLGFILLSAYIFRKTEAV